MCTQAGSSFDAGSSLPQLLTDVKVACIGDSITVGTNDGANLGGWVGRIAAALWNDSLANLPSIQFMGAVEGAAAPNGWSHGYASQTIPVFNNGGSRDADVVLDPIDSRFDPHVALILLGRNDLITQSAATAATRMDSLLAYFYSIAPSVRYMLLQLPPHADPTDDALAVAFNALLPGCVSTAQGLGMDITLVPLYTGMSWTVPGDVTGGHPTASGYVKMANFIGPRLLQRVGLAASKWTNI